MPLQPGESSRVSFEICEPILRFWRTGHTYGSEWGSYRVWIAENSSVGNAVEFELVQK